MGFSTKSAFFQYLIARGVAETVGTLKNRQDLFNPLVRNEKIGWWQNGDRYLHRKLLLDSLFGSLGSSEYAVLLKMYLETYFPILGERPASTIPILKSKFRQLQETGCEAEQFFLGSYTRLTEFKDSTIEDARLFGDGYDFQIKLVAGYKLVEVKGVRKSRGSIRMTQNEYKKAQEYTDDYCLAVISRLEGSPSIHLIFDPVNRLALTESTISSEQIYFTSDNRHW